MNNSSEIMTSNGDLEIVEVPSSSLRQALASQKQKPDGQMEKIERMDKEIASLKEQLRRKDDEREKQLAVLKAKVEDSETRFSLYQWMNNEIAEMKQITAKYSEKTMEMYKAIWKKGIMKASNPSSSEREKMSEELKKLEDVCAEISKHVKKTMTMGIEVMTKCLNQGLPHPLPEPTRPLVRERENVLSDKENAPVENIVPPKKVCIKEEAREESDVTVKSFIGTYKVCEREGRSKCDIRKISITEEADTGCNFIFWKYSNGSTYTMKWIADSVEREGYRVCLDGLVLTFRSHGNRMSSYELTENGLKVSGSNGLSFSFVRV